MDTDSTDTIDEGSVREKGRRDIHEIGGDSDNLDSQKDAVPRKSVLTVDMKWHHTNNNLKYTYLHL